MVDITMIDMTFFEGFGRIKKRPCLEPESGSTTTLSIFTCIFTDNKGTQHIGVGVSFHSKKLKHFLGF